MTPEEARDLLEGTTPGPWRLQAVKGHPHLRHITTGTGHSGDPTAAVCIPVDMTSREGAANMRAKAAVPSMLAMIAGMTEEWGAERQVRGRWVRIVFALNTLWTDDRAIAESAVDDCRDLGLPARIVRRYVTEQEEV